MVFMDPERLAFQQPTLLSLTFTAVKLGGNQFFLPDNIVLSEGFVHLLHSIPEALMSQRVSQGMCRDDRGRLSSPPRESRLT